MKHAGMIPGQFLSSSNGLLFFKRAFGGYFTVGKFVVDDAVL
jgi:hypothetical protein